MKRINMEDILRIVADGEWHTQRQVANALGCTMHEVRFLVADSSVLFVTTPQGFRMAALATPEERRHCYNQLLSRANALVARASKFAHVWGIG